MRFEAGAGTDASYARQGASRRSSRSCRSTSLGGAATSTSARLRRCCATSTSGPGDGCVPSPGSSGNAGLLGSPSCDAAASAGIWRRKPLVARMALAAQQQPRAYYRSPERLPRLARPNFPRGEQGRLTHRTAVYGPVCTVVWEGEAVRPTPYPDWGRSDSTRAARPRARRPVPEGHVASRHRLALTERTDAPDHFVHRCCRHSEILACVAAWAVSETQARVAEAATVQVDTFEMMKNREADAFRAL